MDNMIFLSTTLLADLMAKFSIRDSLKSHSVCLNRKLYGGIKDVLVPKMYTECSTSKVLVMEWVEV